MLDFSNELLLIQYVYDFNLDGLMALRVSDVTSIEFTKTDMLQTQFLEDGVSIRGFSGAANWDDELSEISYEDISSLQAGNKYVQVYERHFSKH